MAESGPVEVNPAHRVVMFNLSNSFTPGMSDADVYEATRKWWKLSSRRCELGKPWAPEWAFAVSGGIVRAVFRIDGWQQATDDDIAGISIRIGRWSFRGMREPDMEAIYVGRDVSAYLRSASGGPLQNPVRYVRCASIGQPAS